MSVNNENAWKAFDTSTDAGRLLKQIYGSKGPPVNVPLPRKSKSSRIPMEGWRPVANKPGQVDPRQATRSVEDERRVAIPHKARAESTFARIDFVERKRGGAVINEELGDLKMRSEAYRPPHQRPMDAAEKDRLSEINAFRGGKGLPSELTAVPLDVLPSELLSRAKEADRLTKVRRRRAGLPEEDAPRPKAKTGGLPGAKGALAEQLLGEIEERRAHLAEMEAMGLVSGSERQIASEINARANELRRLDPSAAKEYGIPDKDEQFNSFAALRVSAPFFRG